MYLLILISSILALSIPQTTYSTPNELTTSVIIPCYHEHAKYLPDLLKMFEQQTELPDEVIIALSESDQVDRSILDALINEKQNFPVILLLSTEKQFAGENRNRASAVASGDIFIFQDADDIPHPQRVAIIKYFFKKYKIKHVMHQYIIIKSYDANFEHYTDFDKIPFFYAKSHEEISNHQGFTNGNIAILKEVAQAIAWPDQQRGQDTIFNKTVYAQFNNYCGAIEIPLLAYRRFLSSYTGPSEHVIAAKKRVRIFMDGLRNELKRLRSLVPDERNKIIKNKLMQINRAHQELSAIAAADQQIGMVQEELQELESLELELQKLSALLKPKSKKNSVNKKQKK